MAQVKKEAVREAILTAAFRQVSENGYHRASMPAIAKEAGITAGNIYRYYPSKFELFFEVLAPWMDRHLTILQQQCAGISDPTDRLRNLLHFMWVTLPETDNNFARNIAQALATKRTDDPSSRDLLHASEKRVAQILSGCFHPAQVSQKKIFNAVRLIFMSHDGFVLNVPLSQDSGKTASIVELMVESLMAALTKRCE